MKPERPMKIIRLMDLMPGHHNNYKVYSVDGISPTIPSCGDGHMGRSVYPFILLPEKTREDR